MRGIADLADVLACPACGCSLEGEDGMLRCDGCGARYHTRPHIDLLPPGKRPPNEGPGDTAEMARRRVAWERRVESGAIAGERAALDHYLDIICAHLRPGAVVLDLGCGTGEILRQVGLRFDGPLTLLGLDIARPMLDAAYRTLRREQRALVMRASTRRHLPLRDGVADIVLRRLAPALSDEIMRVLAPGGAFISASFGPLHWRECYDALPDLPRPRSERASLCDQLIAQGFAAAAAHTWRGHEVLDPQSVLERLLAGPAAFHVDPARDLPRLQELAARSHPPGLLSLTADDEVGVGVKAT